jgi:hypothetical protein
MKEKERERWGHTRGLWWQSVRTRDVYDLTLFYFKKKRKKRERKKKKSLSFLLAVKYVYVCGGGWLR